MQVLVTLADGKGSVLSREHLLQTCWEGRIVGDDAINRAIAEVRRLLDAVGADFEIETVPRVGYRIAGVYWQTKSETDPSGEESHFSRRKLIAGGIAATTVIAASSAAALYRSRNAEVDALIERGRVIQGSGRPGDEMRAEVLFRQAIDRDPRRADAWGWLSIVMDSQDRARETAIHALELDPREPNARTVLAFQRRDLESWADWENELLGILADAPDCARALNFLTFFYQGMGLCDKSRKRNEEAIRLEPFNPSHLQKRALKHWIFGEVQQAISVANKLIELWPRSPGVWNARMVIYAFTDRATAALAILDDVANHPPNLTEPSVKSWRAGLQAIATRAPRDVARATEICTETARYAPGLAANAIMFFSHLGQLDAAYLVAEGLFEGRGAVVQQSQKGSIRDVYSASAWGRTQSLFIPATTNFRSDPRFPDLCQRLGHVDYWRTRGIWPDPFVRGAIDPASLS